MESEGNTLEKGVALRRKKNLQAIDKETSGFEVGYVVSRREKTWEKRVSTLGRNTCVLEEQMGLDGFALFE